MSSRTLVAVLTGAGISTASGIPDYRGPQGLWQRDPTAQDMVTIGPYLADTEVRQRSWLMRRDAGALGAEPNAGHRALVELDRALPMRVLTQNVDGLQQRAGLRENHVLELHGTALRVRCTDCAYTARMEDALERVAAGEPDPACPDCGGILRPCTVMFGETLDPVVLEKAARIAQACDLFIAVGSSLQVHPAAGLLEVAVQAGARLIVVNGEPTPYDDLAEEVIREPISTALPALVARLTG
jgi:NAD-dependent deacetylase